jgi:hypothetical protein
VCSECQVSHNRCLVDIWCVVPAWRLGGSSHSLPGQAGSAQGPARQVTSHVPWQVDEQTHACYTQTMSEWLGCEAIVRQRERESHAAALAKCSSGASLDGHLHRMVHRDSTISNEVRQLAGGGKGGEGQDPFSSCSKQESWVCRAVGPSQS